MRIQFGYTVSPDRPTLGWRLRVPDGFAVEPIDAEIAKRLQNDLVAAGNAPWFDEIWGGVDRFVEFGFGYAALHEGGVVSNCRAWSVLDGVAAVQVSTRARFRRLGLGTLVCSAFIEHCIERGVVPEYSCEAENFGSAALAVRLGFVQLP